MKIPIALNFGRREKAWQSKDTIQKQERRGILGKEKRCPCIIWRIPVRFHTPRGERFFSIRCVFILCNTTCCFTNAPRTYLPFQHRFDIGGENIYTNFLDMTMAKTGHLFNDNERGNRIFGSELVRRTFPSSTREGNNSEVGAGESDFLLLIILKIH